MDRDVYVDWGKEPPALRQTRLAELQRIVERLKQLGAVRVLLFGSRASGEPHRNSDFDLLVVMDEPPPGSFPERLRAVYESVRPRIPTDILVYTKAELAGFDSASMVGQAVRHGRER